jgi:hypothetical protein
MALVLVLVGALTIAATSRNGPSRASPVVPITAPGWVSPLLAKHDRSSQGLRTLDVTAFGAKGNGGDDWAAINAAVRALPDRDAVLYFPPARDHYSLGNHAQGINLYGKRNIRIRGDGWRSMIRLDGRGDPRVAFVFANAGDGLSFDGVGVDCAGGRNTIGIHVAGDRVTIQDSYLTGCLGGAVWIGGQREISIRENYFYGAGYGVLTQESATASRIDVTDNHFNGADVGAGNGTDAIEINSPLGRQSEIEIIGNLIENYTNREMSGFGIGLAHVTGVRVVDNQLRGCGQACIHLEDGTSRVNIARNLIGDFQGSGVQLISGTGRAVRDVAIVENTVVDCGCRSGRDEVSLEGTAGAENITVSRNTLLTCARDLGSARFDVDTGYQPIDVVVHDNNVQAVAPTAALTRCRRTPDR